MMRPWLSIGSPRSRALSRASPRTPPLTRSPSTRPHGRGVRRSSSHRPGRRPSLATARGHPRGIEHPVGQDARTAPLEAGVRVPSSGPDGEHVLPRHVHHRRGPSHPESSQAGECGRPRCATPESDDRPRPTRGRAGRVARRRADLGSDTPGFSRGNRHERTISCGGMVGPSAGPASTTTRRAPGGRPVRFSQRCG